MVYLKSFDFLSRELEESLIGKEQKTYLISRYPFLIFPQKGLGRLEFEPITILYGSNGSGKSTILSLIAKKLNAKQIDAQDKDEMMGIYLKNCKYEMAKEKYREIKMIRSDDIFDYILNVRRINKGIYSDRTKKATEYLNNKSIRMHNFEDYLKFNDYVNENNSTKTMSLNKNLTEQSNGEAALMYFSSEIKDKSIYILDEPENSMSAATQMKLLKFIEESARFFDCQFILATHSPILLGINSAKIYNLDAQPVKVCKWNELENVITYYNFFKDREQEFDKN